jgi:hypothetical protein
MLIRVRRFLGSAIGLGILALCVPGPLGAQSQTGPYPVKLELLAPSSGGNRIPTVTLSGWPIVLKMSAVKELGIGTQVGASAFPVSGDQSFVVFEEPDDCHSWLFDPPICTVNETYLEFNPGSCSGGQLPGAVASLVLLADSSGTNLAGQFTVVGYELDDTSRQTSVLAALVMPSWLLRPPPPIDLCVGALLTPEGPCEGGALGLNSTGVLVRLDRLLDAFNQNNVTTLRAFVVSGRAPQSLNDADGDGVIGANDAELAGFRVISREVAFRVRTLFQIENFLNAPVLVDLDGNGLVTCGFCSSCLPDADCQGGGGGLTPVPR